MNINVTDVGGQAQEQWSWQEHAGCDAILYIAALSEYDALRSDGANLLKQQFALLEQVLSSEAFAGSNVVTILNKHDLFKTKIEDKKRDPVKKHFKNFRGRPASSLSLSTLSAYLSLGLSLSLSLSLSMMIK